MRPKNVVSGIKKFHSRNPDIKIVVTGCALKLILKLSKIWMKYHFYNYVKTPEDSWEKLPATKTLTSFHEKDLVKLTKINPSTLN